MNHPNYPVINPMTCFDSPNIDMYFFKRLPFLVGLLSSGAPELFPGICPTADTKDSFVTTDTSKTFKGGAVGFADFASVSVFLPRVLSVCMTAGPSLSGL